ncbi:MAG: cysteine--tRNA ligase [Methanobrevibacter sp.]|nr:cysteine--tRNA ligase [Methanobrevibacter sp.]
MEIYSTMTREKEELNTLFADKIKLFVCGPTVYDDAHIGHGRTYISFDTIKRYLEFKGYSVFYLQNITDIDDKIINRAKESGVDSKLLAEKFEKRFIEDMAALNVNNVNYFARATDHIDEILDQIQRLIDKGFAYVTETGVYFEVAKFEDYGKLSNRKLEDLETHRIDIDSSKKSPHDFALWKNREAPEYAGEPVWDSPWGKGRPGWHIEDTAITEKYFGPQYDIHGGGLDLIFPHHDSEIAQMEAVSGKEPLVQYWMHTGFLNVSGEKMSKSLGNFITIRDLLKEYSGDTFRLLVLLTHYRSPIDFSEVSLHQAERNVSRIKNYLETLDGKIEESFEKGNLSEDILKLVDLEENELSEELINFDYYESNYDALKEGVNEFFTSMDDDFSTPKAIAAIFSFIKQSNKDLEEDDLIIDDLLAIKHWFKDISQILGIDFFDYKEQTSGNEEELLNIIADVRLKLRAEKQYELSDEIRDKLISLGIEVSD